MAPAWEQALSKDSKILLAVSGGADSVLMTIVLSERWSCHVLHVNHHLSGEESDTDAAFVEALAEERGLGFTLKDIHDEDLKTAEVSSSLEARLREERYRITFEVAQQAGCDAVAFGHNQTDVAETFLIMALRGAGPRGLGSMTEVRRVDGQPTIIRPLLQMSREEIRARLESLGQPWREDPMNATTKVRRNKLRHLVFPVLSEIEPAAVKLLARSAQLCSEAEVTSGGAGPDPSEAILAEAGEGILASRLFLGRLERALRKRILRTLFERVSAGADDGELFTLPPSFDLTNRLSDRMEKKDGSEATFSDAGPLAAFSSGAYLLIHRGGVEPKAAMAALLENSHHVILRDPEEAPVALLNSSQRFTNGTYQIRLSDRLTLMAEVLDKPEQLETGSQGNLPEEIAWFDTRSLRKDLWLGTVDVETRVPIGDGHSKAVGEILAERGIPAHLRKQVCAVFDERGPLWIPSIYRVRSAFVTPRTQTVVRLKLEEAV